jgi:glycine reductase
MSPLAQSVGSNRIVTGKAVPHPFGDPSMVPDDERRYRRRLVERALESLTEEVDGPTIFEESGS